MSFAVSVEKISKRYRLGEINRGQILADIHRWWMRRKANTRTLPDDAEPAEKGDFWALKNISFEIEKGETLAIIGANGAGKSTLLKIISRITAPTTGRVRIKGRIGSLLEVGTGFHPELTGRDNVFLNGAILGMSRGEVRSKFDDIVGFAGLRAVYRHTGQALLERDVCAACLFSRGVPRTGNPHHRRSALCRGSAIPGQVHGEIEEIVRSGRTLLFVSHGAGLVQRVCRRAILLKHGTIIFDGDADKAFEAYAGSQTPPATGPAPPSEPAAKPATPSQPAPSQPAPASQRQPASAQHEPSAQPASAQRINSERAIGK